MGSFLLRVEIWSFDVEPGHCRPMIVIGSAILPDLHGIGDGFQWAGDDGREEGGNAQLNQALTDLPDLLRVIGKIDTKGTVDL